MENAPRFPVAQLPCLQAFLSTLLRIVYCCIATAVSLRNNTVAPLADHTENSLHCWTCLPTDRLVTVCSNVSKAVTLLDSKHVTLLLSKGCSSPKGLTVFLSFRCSLVFCWQSLHSVSPFFARPSAVVILPHVTSAVLLHGCSPRAAPK
jgi:hypothetical protein